MRFLLIIYDNDSYIHWFPQGSAYIAAVLKKKGVDVEVYNQDIHHYPEKHLTKYLDENIFDAVGLGIIGGYYQYDKLLKLSSAINRSKHRPFYIIGGHGPSPEPEYFFKKTLADLIVIGEGELIISEVFDALANKSGLKDIKGIAYREGDRVFVNERRELIQEIDQIPLPAYELFPIYYYRMLRMPHCKNNDFVMPVLSGRGCPFRCNFCYRMDKGFRPRSEEAIIEEISMLKENYNVSYIAFSDELLMSSVSRTKTLCEKMIKSGLDVKWDCNGRLNFAKPEILKIMKKAGCVFINYGIEAFDNEILKNMKKGLTTQQIISGIEATLNEGISPGYNIIFGNIGENKKTLEKGVQFLLKYDDFAQMRTIRPVTPYPGSPLYYYAIEKGLLKDCEDFYENKHLNSDLLSINFTELTDDEFHKALHDANVRLLQNYFQSQLKFCLEQTKKLYYERDKNFRGFRQS